MIFEKKRNILGFELALRGQNDADIFLFENFGKV